jgi:hypothetical protein
MTHQARRFLKQLASEFEFTAELTKGGHVRLILPNGAIVHTGSTPSDHRVVRQVRAELRRALRRER